MTFLLAVALLTIGAMVGFLLAALMVVAADDRKNKKGL